MATPLLAPGPWNRFVGAADPGLILEILRELDRLSAAAEGSA